MKNRKKWIIAILCMFCLVSTNEAQCIEEIAFHQTIRLDGSTHGDMDPKSTFMRIDSKGNIHVSFYSIGDFGMGQLCHKIIGGNLTIIDDGPESSGEFTFVPGLAMDIDSHDYPHIVYGKGLWKSGRAQEIRYAYFNGSAWKNQVINTLQSREPSIKLDSDGKPHISYVESPFMENYSFSSLNYAYLDGLGWHMQTVEGNSYIWSQQITVGSDGKPQIVYIAGPDFSVQMLKYARFNGLLWEIETVAYEDVGSYASIALDLENNPHISYGNHTLKYAYFNGTTWHISQISQTSQSPIEENIIALDSQGKPHIFYTYALSSTASYWEPNNASYAYYTGASWIINRVPAENGTYLPMRGISLALDSKNIPHITYKFRVETGSVVAYEKGTFYSPFPLITALLITVIAICLLLIAAVIIVKMHKIR